MQSDELRVKCLLTCCWQVENRSAKGYTKFQIFNVISKILCFVLHTDKCMVTFTGVLHMAVAEDWSHGVCWTLAVKWYHIQIINQPGNQLSWPEGRCFINFLPVWIFPPYLPTNTAVLGLQSTNLLMHIHTRLLHRLLILEVVIFELIINLTCLKKPPHSFLCWLTAPCPRFTLLLSDLERGNWTDRRPFECFIHGGAKPRLVTLTPWVGKQRRRFPFTRLSDEEQEGWHTTEIR